jgi:hypothetical protein
MQLKFYPRHGNHANWSRWLEVKDNDGNVLKVVALVMITESTLQTEEREALKRGVLSKMRDVIAGKKIDLTDLPKRKNVRFGKVFAGAVKNGQLVNSEKVLWEGELPEGPPPGRAFCLAAKLCDDEGNADIPVPEWLG